MLKGETPGRSQKMGADAALYIGETHSVLIDKRCIETVSAEQNASGRRETKKKKLLYHGGRLALTGSYHTLTLLPTGNGEKRERGGNDDK